MLVFCVQVNWLPVICSGGDFKSMILPSVTLAIAMVLQIYQTGPYGGAGRTEPGLCDGSPRQRRGGVEVLWLNVFPNSLLPLITMLAFPQAPCWEELRWWK